MKHIYKKAIGMFAVLAAIALSGFAVHANAQVATPVGWNASALIQQQTDLATYFPELYSAAQSAVASTVGYAKLGAVSGPDNPGFVNWSINGVNTRYYRVPMLASTTPCAFLSPNATSTMTLATIAVASSSAQATTFTIASSTTAYATTTSFWQATLGAALLGTTAWVPQLPAQSTAMNVGTSTGILAPNTWVVTGVAGVTGGFPGGYCEAEMVVF